MTTNYLRKWLMVIGFMGVITMPIPVVAALCEYDGSSSGGSGGSSSSSSGGGSSGGQTDTKKWFPGHYVMATENDFGAKSKGWAVLKGQNKDLFQGIWLYVTWGEIESAPNTYHWEKIDSMLNALPPGKKLGLALAWQSWHGGKNGCCPRDMLDNPLYGGGYVGTGPAIYSTFYLTPTMDRYLAYVKAFAARYDNDDRLAFVVTGEINGKAYLQGKGYDAATTLKNMQRLPELVGHFKRTPYGMLGDWWPYGGDVNAFIEKVRVAGGGYGGPDIHKTPTNISANITANAGRQANWQGMEWMDLKEFAESPFPNVQMGVAESFKTNFIWWNPNNRRREGGFDFDTDVINYLRADKRRGISTACPTNMRCDTN